MIESGQTVKSATKHSAARLESNFSWKPDWWSNDQWSLALNHAVSLAGFWDKNDVYLISWAPNIIITPANKTGCYPYLQFGFGVALMSEDKFESEDLHPTENGASEMGSYGQFESSLALGLMRNQFSIRAKIYHYSNAGLADPNGGMNVAEFGLGYRFE
ncbi:MAG TPA: acyloxyacyl hydrolase [Halioglobus sp.]